MKTAQVKMVFIFIFIAGEKEKTNIMYKKIVKEYVPGYAVSSNIAVFFSVFLFSVNISKCH